MKKESKTSSRHHIIFSYFAISFLFYGANVTINVKKVGQFWEIYMRERERALYLIISFILSQCMEKIKLWSNVMKFKSFWWQHEQQGEGQIEDDTCVLQVDGAEESYNSQLLCSAFNTTPLTFFLTSQRTRMSHTVALSSRYILNSVQMFLLYRWYAATHSPSRQGN